MPLNTAYLPKVDGLQTENSAINSDPRALADCIDVVSDTDDTLESRHGHPTAAKGATEAAAPVDLYKYSADTEKIFVATYKTAAGKFQFKTIKQAGDEITSDDSTESALREIDNKSIARLGSVNKKPISFFHDERLFFLTDYGLYFTGHITPGSTDAIKADFPVIRTATVESVWLESTTQINNKKQEARHWLVPAYQVNVKIVIEIQAKDSNEGERIIESPTSRIYEVKNFNLSNAASDKGRTSNTLIKISDLSLSHVPAVPYTVKFYRTLQFEIAPDDTGLISERTEYFFAGEVTSESGIFGDIYLTNNDDTVKRLAGLYNDTSNGTFASTNHIPPPAKNVTEFSNYYIYSNITPPTVAQLGLKNTPSDGDTLSVKLSGAAGVTPIEKTFTFKTTPTLSTQVQIVTNPESLTSEYIANETDAAFRGLRPTEGLNVKLRIVPGTEKGQVEPYGKITKFEPILPSGANAVVRITPDTAGFDINKFNQPGVAAIVDSAGKIKLLFSYSNYRTVSASTGFIDFEGGVCVGRSMPTSASSGTYYMYAINVENLQTTLDTESGDQVTTSNLPVYYGNGSSYLSLLPCKGSFPLYIAKPSPVSNTLFSYLTVTVNNVITPDELVINPFYTGWLSKPQGRLLDEMAISLCDAFQNQFNNGSAIVSSFSVGDGVMNLEILDPTYEIIEIKRTGSDIYEPQVSSSYEEFIRSEKMTNAFVISKQNNPEIIPYGGTNARGVAGIYFPTRIGNTYKAIVACASTKDSVYLFKEDGIARLSIISGALTAIVDNIYMLDNTTFCQSAGSVQSLNDSIIFLAQDGVYSVTGGYTQKLSGLIENEIKKALSQCRAASKLEDIRSFANSSKGLYGLHIPLAGTSYVTYVLNTATMRWTKWSNQFKGTVVDDDGRLTTLVGDENDNYWRQDRYTNGDPRNEADQVDDELDLGTASVVDTELIRTISLTGIGTKVDRIGAKQIYYKHSDGSLDSVQAVKVNADEVNIVFTNTPVAFNTADKLVVGVNSFVEFQPFTNGNPSSLKMFSGFHVHTIESVKDLQVSFRTEARSTYSVVKNFNTSPTDRTVYRCYIPLEAARGRFLYRKVLHVRPYESFLMPAQTIVLRDSGSERVNK